MSMRKDHGRSRALRPAAENLEPRQLLAATVSGMDTAGDKWTLKLLGPGTLQVVKQTDPSTGDPGTLDSATEINSITIAGTDPRHTRLIGTVVPATGSSGQVFFQDLNEIPNRSNLLAQGLGILAINMPDFYLGYTGSAMAPSGTPVAEINIPDGVNSLRFGGVDTTKFFGTDATNSPAQDNQNDEFLIDLGLPYAIGTSIVVNTLTSNTQPGVTSSGSTTPGDPTQKSIVFDVNGRVNLFEANEIDGNTTNAAAADGFTGGTILGSFEDPLTAIPGNFGFVRIGGNATNFSVVTGNQLANMYIGGETNNVAVLAANGSRNLYFGKGLDTTTILTHTIENLYANRDAVNSTVESVRQIGNLSVGGDVDNSNFLSGYIFPDTTSGASPALTGLENLAGAAQTNIADLSGTTAPTAISIPTPSAQANGQITAFISGNVNNSVFAASDMPINQVESTTPTSVTQIFGNSQDALLPLGRITARVEGSIQNSTATPDSPKTAFYANKVNLVHAVVVPPRVVEPPLPPPTTPITLPGIPVVFPSSESTKHTTTKVSTVTTGSGSGSSSSPVGIVSTTNPNHKATPKGPATKK
jgi:hypothetical protein